MQTYVAESGRRLENLALWELVAAVQAMPDVGEWVLEWEALGKVGLTADGVRQRFRQFIADARKQAGLEDDLPQRHEDTKK